MRKTASTYSGTLKTPNQSWFETWLMKFNSNVKGRRWVSMKEGLNFNITQLEGRSSRISMHKLLRSQHNPQLSQESHLKRINSQGD